MDNPFIFAIITGVLSGVLYDFFRLFRLIFNRHFFLDMLYWVIIGFAAFLYLLAFNNGEIRMIYLLTIFFGAVTYIFTFSRISLTFQRRIAKIIKIRLKKVKNKLKSFKKVLQSHLNIYYNKSNLKSRVVKKRFGEKENDYRN
ncbi:MAG: spore cortex biosynthesis protein YabQ [Clostridiales bacterium]|nr:spore cortex biosynthesis protein YabQ [Clostridiales bacterium]